MEPMIAQQDNRRLSLSDHTRSTSSVYQRAIPIVMLVLVVMSVSGGLAWLQNATQRAIKLGYPQPQIHLNPLSDSVVRLHSNVQFSTHWVGRELSYYWNFGDQNIDTSGPTVSHAYQSNGNFTVTISVTDPTGQVSNDSMNIQVMPPPPSASFVVTTSGGYSYVYATFDASSSVADSSTSISSYYWDFGDGNRDSTSSPQDYHYYYYSGTYTISLTVVDALGQSSNVYTQSISI